MKITGAVLRKMRAQRPYAQSRPIDVTSVELDEPGPHEVLIRMTAAGLCHSDLSVVDGNRPRPLPMLLGHEGAGVVEQVGADVTEFAPGDHVVTVFLPRCGQCANCATASSRVPRAPRRTTPAFCLLTGRSVGSANPVKASTRGLASLANPSTTT